MGTARPGSGLMLALTPRSRTYPVLLPDRPQVEWEPTPRRARRRTLASIVVMAILAMLPALALVSQRTAAARTGYTILGLRHQVEALEAENARLLATATALRAPDRIERIATRDLGMVAPRSQQVAALPLTTPIPAVADVPAPTVWERLSALFVHSDASASEPSQ